MAIGADIIVRIATDASRAADDVDQAAGRFGKFQASMQSMVAPATVALGAVAAFGKQTVDSASAVQQAMGAVDSVFGTSAGAVKEWAAGAADAVGLSTSAYGQLAAVTGASLKSMGLSTDEAAASTKDLITMGADLASTYGGTTEEAVQALGSALRGEADPAERFGLALKQSNVAARMAADGTDKLTGTAFEAAKAQTIMALATEQAAGANGQFARESDTAEGSAQRAAAQYENMKAALGEQLLPVMAQVMAALSSFAQWVSENSALVLTLVGIVGGLAAAVLAVNAALALASAATAVWNGIQLVGKGITAAATAIQWAWNAALAANPLGLVILAIVAVIAGIVLLWNKCEWFRDLVTASWEAIAGAATAAWDFIKGAAETVWNWIADKAKAVGDIVVGVWDAIKGAAETVWNWIKDTIGAVWGWIVDKANGAGATIENIWNGIKSVGTSCWNAIKSAVDALLTPFRAVKDAVSWLIDKLKMAWDWATKVISKIPFVGGMMSAAAPAAAVTPAASTSAGLRSGLVRSGTRAGGPAGVNITVTGALDPVAVAEQIESLLTRQARRTHGVSIGRLA